MRHFPDWCRVPPLNTQKPMLNIEQIVNNRETLGLHCLPFLYTCGIQREAWKKSYFNKFHIIKTSITFVTRVSPTSRLYKSVKFYSFNIFIIFEKQRGGGGGSNNVCRSNVLPLVRWSKPLGWYLIIVKVCTSQLNLKKKIFFSLRLCLCYDFK